MSDFSLTLVLQIKTSKIINDVAKVRIKSEKITPYGGIFHVKEHFWVTSQIKGVHQTGHPAYLPPSNIALKHLSAAPALLLI